MEAYLEELIVRRELADNFCFYVPNYDSLDCCYDWARQTLDAHRHDKREHIYTRSAFPSFRFPFSLCLLPHAPGFLALATRSQLLAADASTASAASLCEQTCCNMRMV